MNLTPAEITDITQGKSSDWKTVSKGIFQHIPTGKHYHLTWDIEKLESYKLIEIQAIAPTIWVPITIGEKLIQLWGKK